MSQRLDNPSEQSVQLILSSGTCQCHLCVPRPTMPGKTLWTLSQGLGLQFFPLVLWNPEQDTRNETFACSNIYYTSSLNNNILFGYMAMSKTMAVQSP